MVFSSCIRMIRRYFVLSLISPRHAKPSRDGNGSRGDFCVGRARVTTISRRRQLIVKELDDIPLIMPVSSPRAANQVYCPFGRNSLTGC